SVDLMKGKRVIAFLSLTCPHCKIGAQKLNLIHQQNPDLPIYFILNGETSDLQEFLESSKTKDIEYRFMSMQEGFIKNAGINLPAILWVKDGQVVNRTKYTELDATELIAWFQNP
ncbi:MAG: TlpA family protein disulfide reductase, partial [Bacteroidia bacterium]